MSVSSAVSRHVDVAVLGAGTAGLAAYRAAFAVTPNVVLVEGGVYGTTCARVGCMPSKLLIAAAEAAYHAHHADPFGVHCDVRVDGREVMARVRGERDRFVGFVLDSVDRIPAEHRLQARARFVGPRRIEAGDELIEAKSVVIATGSSPLVPPFFEAVSDRLVVNDDVFAWETLPASVVVFGTGVIGLEIGQALHRLGVRVRVFGRRGTVGPLTDPTVRAAATELFRGEFPLQTDADARVHEIRHGGDGVIVTFEGDDGTACKETFAFALIAAGRRPNVAGLGLESTGVVCDKAGIPRFDRTTLQCGDTPIFIAGDVNADVPLLHEAADEGTIAGENAARYPNVQAGQRRTSLVIMFTDPQIAVVGPGWKALLERGNVAVGEVSFADQGRSRVLLQNRGIGRVYADQTTGQFLGAELLGPRAEHLAHLLAWAHQQSLTVAQMLALPFYHPVIEEGLRTALRDVSQKLVH